MPLKESIGGLFCMSEVVIPAPAGKEFVTDGDTPFEGFVFLKGRGCH